MTTKLDDELKREVLIGKRPYTLLLTPSGLKLTEKGKRIGIGLAWKDIVSGDAALATALQASVVARVLPKKKPAVADSAPTPAPRPTRRRKGA